MATVHLVAVPQHRLALPAEPGWIRALIPSGHVGAYLLLRDNMPIYVGRSDRCLRRRLCGHEKIAEASHIVWEPCRDPLRAFYLEALWYDQLSHLPSLRNQIHPARPEGNGTPCPFCSLDAWAVKAILPAWPTLAEAPDRVPNCEYPFSRTSVPLGMSAVD